MNNEKKRVPTEENREQREQRMIRNVLAKVASVEALTDEVCVVKMHDGKMFAMRREAVKA